MFVLGYEVLKFRCIWDVHGNKLAWYFHFYPKCSSRDVFPCLGSGNRIYKSNDTKLTACKIQAAFKNLKGIIIRKNVCVGSELKLISSTSFRFDYVILWNHYVPKNKAPDGWTFAVVEGVILFSTILTFTCKSDIVNKIIIWLTFSSSIFSSHFIAFQTSLSCTLWALFYSFTWSIAEYSACFTIETLFNISSP